MVLTPASYYDIGTMIHGFILAGTGASGPLGQPRGMTEGSELRILCLTANLSQAQEIAYELGTRVAMCMPISDIVNAEQLRFSKGYCSNTRTDRSPDTYDREDLEYIKSRDSIMQ